MTDRIPLDNLTSDDLDQLYARAEAAEAATRGLANVRGRCPACGNTRMFLGEGGYVTCPRIDCPEPDAASTLLEQPTT